MKVLALDQFSDLGGAQQNLLLLLEAMRSSGWAARVGLPGDGVLIERATSLGFETVRIACGPFSLGRKRMADILRFAVQLPVLRAQIGTHVREFQPDLVYVNGPRVLPAAALAGLQVPVLFHAHSYLPAGVTRKLSQRALRRLRGSVVASCRFVAEPYASCVGQARVAVVLNGVPGPEEPLYHPNPAAPRIGCIGRISQEKGQLEFLQAAAIIHRAVPRTRFFIYGAPLFSRDAEEYAGRVRAAAGTLPVEFPGWAGDIYTVLPELDLVLVPSGPNEATTRVILEACASGVPVIAFRSGGIPEVVEDGHTGLLADSVEQMAAQAISLFGGDAARLDALSQAAREHWRTRFTAARWQREMLEQMQKAAA